MASCNVCFRKCEIREGSTGFCGVRSCRDGKVVCDNYGRVTSLALDPIEKKPLRRYYPGSAVLSVGSFGCNLRCPFCQNHDISWSEESFVYGKKAEKFSPEDILRAALSCADAEISELPTPTTNPWWATNLSGTARSLSGTQA